MYPSMDNSFWVDYFLRFLSGHRYQKRIENLHVVWKYTDTINRLTVFST